MQFLTQGLILFYLTIEGNRSIEGLIDFLGNHVKFLDLNFFEEEPRVKKFLGMIRK